MKLQKTPIAFAFALISAAPFVAQAAPTVSFKKPDAGATISQKINQSSACEVSGSNIDRVKFYLDSTLLNTEENAPWQCNIDPSKFQNKTYTLKAVAYDSAGKTATATRSVTLQNGTTPPTTGSGPTVSFKTPSDGAAITKAISQSSACEVVGSGITKVQFFLGATALNTEGSSPWNCNIDPAKFAPGTYPLKAVAYNSSGASSTAQINVNIGSGTTTNTSPTVSLTAPVVGATLSGTAAPYAATASDTGGSVAKVDFYLVNASGGQTLVGTDTTNDYAGSFDTTKFANGTYTLMAVATDNLGANASTQRSVSIDNTGGGTGGTSSIAASDILTRATADIPFAEQSGYTAQVIKTYTSAPQIPESGIHSTQLANGETLRMGKVLDPVNAARKALAFQVHTSDPITSGGKRAELSVSPNIEMNKVYWIAFSVYVYDWGTLSDADQSLFGIQMHSGNNNLNLSPSFGIYTTNQGRNFTVRTRWSTSSSPSPSNSVKTDNAVQPIPFGRWIDFVLKFKHNTSGGGFLQVWMDGNQIVNHVGNLGFNTPGYNDYAKFGYYNWGGSSMSSTARKVLLRSPTIVADPTGQTYTHEQLRTLVGSSSASTAGTSTSSSDTSTLGSGTTTTAGSGGGGLCSTISCAAQ
jgi:hypothetical protein